MTKVQTFLAALVLLFSCSPLFAQASLPDNYFSAMQWRCVGPHRGGRVLAVSGVRGQPNTFYFGSVGGGVWKTTDAGRTWEPIFDKQPVASIGALAVSTSNPEVIYVGSGEADMRSDISLGNGMYKSTDGGTTWSYLGLRDTRQIGRVLIDPKDPDIVFVAALGHGFGPNTERGVFRSTDGGKNWTRVLYKNENTGAIDIAFDPDNSKTIYASLWNVHRVPWSAYPPVTEAGGGLYKSTDGGETWNEITGGGFPSGKLGRMGIDIPISEGGKRVYVLVDADAQSGLYRSDDSGKHWTRVSTETRILSRGWYFGEVRSDPKNSNIVYVSNVSIYRSLDGGKTFKAMRGAPGGDDYHSLWIDPENPHRMISGVDQGTLVTVNGGETWSSWYNQPTAQFYHVAVDNQWPYWLYGAQQDSGTVAIKSRSDFGQITFRDWHPIGAGESGYILPDPANSEIVYGGSTGGELYRFDTKTGVTQDVSPTPAEIGAGVTYRYQWTTPLAFSFQAPYALYQSSQFLFRTIDGGHSWTTISPDLTLRPGEKETDAKGVIYTIAPSPRAAGTIWIGTDNGLIHLTRDEGKTWTAVTPKDVQRFSMISLIDASPHDAASAYAAIDRHQTDDIHPYIYRTHDFGKTWTLITKGLPSDSYVHAVREDPVRKGLLFAGTETGIFVSFNDGDDWQSLQLNLPNASVRDLVIKDNDLVIATHGRSFWILDNISPLRELTNTVAAEPVHLFKPVVAVRVRKNVGRDTPLPPETPAGKNPPAGAIIDYSLDSIPTGPVTLEIFDAKGTLVRKYSSADAQRPLDESQPFPTYWFSPPAPLSKTAGMNRFVWDLRYEQPPTLRYSATSATAFGEDTELLPQGPLVSPGTYQVKLTVEGRSYTAPLEVKLDPRIKLMPLALNQQTALALKITEQMRSSFKIVTDATALRTQLNKVQSNDPEISAAVNAVDKKAAEIVAVEESWPPTGIISAATVNSAFGNLLTLVESADTAPTMQANETYRLYERLLSEQSAKWQQLKSKDVATLNTKLAAKGLPPLTPP